MRLQSLVFVALAFALLAVGPAGAQQASAPTRNYNGFDANDYPGDAMLPALHQQFAFTGYWLTDPPNTHSNSWVGKRDILVRNGFGFLVLADGRLDKEILHAQKSGTSPADFGRQDAAQAVAAARREGFPAHTILFLDQEEGGRMLPEQAAYLFAWTEAVAAADYLPGLYASGKPVPDGKGPDGKPVTITTLEDVRQQVAAKHLHPIAFWVIQDTCPPAPGCVIRSSHPPSPDLSGTPNAIAWQYAQSPQEKDLTRACNATYTAGECYAPGLGKLQLDLSTARSADPSHGR